MNERGPSIRRALWLCGGALSILLASCAAWSFRPAVPQLLYVDGVPFPVSGSKEDVETRVVHIIETGARDLLEQATYLRGDEVVWEVPSARLGLYVDVEAEAKRALAGLRSAHVGPKQGFGVFVYRRLTGVPEAFHMQLKRQVDEELATSVWQSFARAVHRQPKDAALLIDEHRIVHSERGRQLMVDASVVRLVDEAAGEGTLLIDAVLDRPLPRVLDEHLAPVDVSKVLAVYETSFRGKAGPRAVNIRTAGRYLDGAILLPGEMLSFNQTVGRRIYGRGFVDAPVIVNDEMESDVGGGVCQVATTLHAAAVFGNIEVVRRRSHSRPSGYAPLGLDATVIDGKVDLQLRNPYDEPLLVHVSFPGRYLIRVELLGKSPTAQVEHAAAVTGSEPFSRRIWHRTEVLEGGFEKKQKGSPGMDVVSVLRIVHADGKVERKKYFSKYYPVPEVFWVSEQGKDVDLPDMPEGAEALVVDGEVVAENGDQELWDSAPNASDRPETEVPSYREADGSTRDG